MKIPKARKLRSGMWFIQLRIAGGSVSVSARTEKECRDKARLIKAEHMAGKRNVRIEGLTLRQAIDRYIGSRDNVLSPSTVCGYTMIRNNRFHNAIDSPLGGWSDPGTMRKIYIHLAKKDREKAAGKLSNFFEGLKNANGCANTDGKPLKLLVS
jgi:hypothetical protein